jgi:hypothetical protein
MVPDGAGGMIIAWQDYRFGSSDIYAQRVDALGIPQWTAGGVAVCQTTGDQRWCVALPAGLGSAVIVWADQRGDPESGVYAQRLSAAGVPQWAFNGVPLVLQSAVVDFVAAIPDGATRSTMTLQPGYDVAWRQQHTGTADYQLVVQHVSRDGAGLWTGVPGGGVLLVPMGDVGTLAIASDGAGVSGAANSAIVAWQETLDAGADIYARRVNSAGTFQWPGHGVDICTLTGDQSNPQITYVGNGYVIIVWEDGRIADQDIYAQKVSNGGITPWLAKGLPICRALHTQSTPVIVSDAAGGAIVAWRDSRSGFDQLNAQRVDGNGLHQWHVDGIALSTVSGGQMDPAIVADGSGGAIVTWTDSRDGPSDIYAQRVDAAGNLLWDAVGVPISRASSNQIEPILVNDAGSGAFIAWADGRVGTNDIYAAHAASSGVATAAPAAPASQGNSGSPAEGVRLIRSSANPAGGKVEFTLELAREASVTIDVLDSRGRRLRTLPGAGAMGSGRYTVSWDGKDDAGEPVASGVYYVRAQSGDASSVERVMEVR